MSHTISRTEGFFIIIALVCTFFFGTAQAHAYYTTAQDQIDLRNGTGLFLIQYGFGMANKEVLLPVLAQDTDAKDEARVSYEILNEKDEKVQGKAVGIVLSSASVHDGLYVTPKGTAKKFTLAVFFKPETPGTGEQYRLHVTNLPFNFDGTQKLQLNPSELKYYTTKLLPL